MDQHMDPDHGPVDRSSSLLVHRHPNCHQEYISKRHPNRISIINSFSVTFVIFSIILSTSSNLIQRTSCQRIPIIMSPGQYSTTPCNQPGFFDEDSPSLDDQPVEECCACDEAKYEVIFEGLWSKFTHPKDFPANSWLTHFSDMIGASHSSDFRMWEYGGYASEGLQEVVELGITKKLEAELKAESNKIRTIIKARGLWHPNLNGKTFAVFRVDKKHHLMSLVSMLGPSPDWFVGVSAMELCLRNCSWITEKVMNLYLWDAGTDSGQAYLSPNQPQIPHQRISRIMPVTNSNMSDSPFYDVTGSRMNPFARLTVSRQRMYEKPCDEENDITAGLSKSPSAQMDPDEDRREYCLKPSTNTLSQLSSDDFSDLFPL